MGDMTFGDVSRGTLNRLARVESALPVKRGGMVVYSESAVTVPGAHAVLASGQISPSRGVQSVGNVFPFVLQGNFGFISTGDAITIYWDGTNGSVPLVIRRANGDSLTIPRGSITIAGLNPKTNYGFAPFLAVAQPQSLSFVAGDSGSPRYAFSPSISADAIAKASQFQRLSVNERITDGLVYAATTVAGGNASGTGTNASGRNPYIGEGGKPTLPAPI